MVAVIRKAAPFVVAFALIYAMWLLPAWDQGTEKVPPDTKPTIQHPAGLPPNHPPVSPGAANAQTAPMTNGRAASGATGAQGASSAPGTVPSAADPRGLPLDAAPTRELARALQSLPDEASRRTFEEAFRLTFTSARDQRDYRLARERFDAVLEKAPQHAPCYRGLAYAELNTTMDTGATIKLYERALELDPDYGEAHYALAFMLGPGEPERGAPHFKRALELGVADDRNLGTRFYPGVK